MFLYSLEAFISFLFFWFIITQLIIPLLANRKTFPLFRKEAKLREEMVDVNQQVLEKELKTKIETVKKEKGI